jgi:surface polysaccharide O-acyltransferase-like enzyme
LIDILQRLYQNCTPLPKYQHDTTLVVLFGFSRISLGYIRKIFFPFLDYWFIYAYVLLYILSPLINVGLERISERTSKSIYIFFVSAFCLIAFVNDRVVALGRGYTFLFSVFSYITGRMMSMYQLFAPKTVKRSIMYWLLGTFFTAFGAIFFIYFGKGTCAWHMFSYNSPFVFLSSIFSFRLLLRCHKETVGLISQQFQNTYW